MILLSVALFISLLVCGLLPLSRAQAEDLALAQLSRTKRSTGSKDGVVRASPVHKPEDLAFEAPPLGHTLGATGGDAPLDLLKDVQLLDTVLLASVDGRFHAVNRSTGRPIWSMQDDSTAAPSQNLLHNLVRTQHNTNVAADLDPESQQLYIIEPQSGDIFILPSSSTDSEESEPLRRLPYSVPQLVELSPFSFDDPNRVFVGHKETSIIELDLDEGVVNRVMGSTNHWQNPLDESDDWVDQRRRRVVQIGRTDYTIKVISHNTVLQTLSFSSYGPNNMHKSLQGAWRRTPDGIYLESDWEGRMYAFESKGEHALWATKFQEPIVAVFDVVAQGSGPRSKPFILLQPRPKLQELFRTRAAAFAEVPDKTVISRIGDSLFAMGHVNYPLVNMANPPRRIEASDTELVPRCEGLDCFVGLRIAQRDDKVSRISRLLDPAPSPESASSPSEKKVEQEKNVLEQPEPSSSEFAALPFPSRLTEGTTESQVIGLLSQSDNIRPKLERAPSWALLIPLVGGFVAVWLILRKYMNTNANREDRPTRRESMGSHESFIVRPSHSRQSSISRSRNSHAIFVGATTYTTPATPAALDADLMPEQSEKVNVISPSDDPDVNITLAVEEARVGAGLGVPSDVRDGDESDKEEGDQQDGKKKRRRGGRGKKNKNKAPPADAASGSQSNGKSSSDSASGSNGYVMVDREINVEPTPAKMELPLPVTTSSSSLVVGNKILGYGSHGTIVYEGSLQGRAVAVKRLLQDFVTLASHEVTVLLQADDHPNVIRYFFSMTRESFLYIALELCPCSLADLIETPSKHPAIVGSFDPKKALSQITQGLRHLHNLKIVHRDIKPQNILVSRPKGDGQHRMLISDFGLCKKLDVDQTSFLPTMAAGGGQSLFAAGTPGWRAPEILRGDVSLEEETGSDTSKNGSNQGSSSTPSNETRLTKSVDIFALGCLFYYVLVNGEHPFGERYIREVNILKGEMNLSGLEKFGEEGVEAEHLIEWMLEQDPKARPDTDAILLHPFFWTPAKRLAFLQDASDRFEIMEREPRDPGLVALETGAFDVVGADWHKRLDKTFIDNLGKYRKYQGASVQDLLRALRNKKHHYQDLPDNVKRHLGPLPDGFLSYFTRRFPALFLHVYSTISDLPLRHEPMFRTYFELEH
ncbi:Serine/threonine-protein kinase/endoribonuclease IRE1 AltName: Full=Endoplasmic reticulum-to-nucleus signaling 1; Includes: RecName: Full=Serine/threonine-protein kinase; Includes: RecName: Full=Endoribonuclease; Flags: Precursor [Serendipita indica DSM 11827]|nr:Serine/threonine-protein kinase/endoribonuclease IRE1 AltName: Full=Endoplasmic reticulum-to-nucleus signaling 1; Includes: RecName: Full=Serine/threonine-protein kinase; Includes: RecName: Full=Endoribonuclease; Flags: Precursor [Serendipita indica DSM 11827]